MGKFSLVNNCYWNKRVATWNPGTVIYNWACNMRKWVSPLPYHPASHLAVILDSSLTLLFHIEPSSRPVDFPSFISQFLHFWPLCFSSFASVLIWTPTISWLGWGLDLSPLYLQPQCSTCSRRSRKINCWIDDLLLCIRLCSRLWGYSCKWHSPNLCVCGFRLMWMTVHMSSLSQKLTCLGAVWNVCALF